MGCGASAEPSTAASAPSPAPAPAPATSEPPTKAAVEPPVETAPKANDTAKAPKPDNAAVPKADDTASAPQADEPPSAPSPAPAPAPATSEPPTKAAVEPPAETAPKANDTAKAPKPDNAAVPKADDTASAPQADEPPSAPSPAPAPAPAASEPPTKAAVEPPAETAPKANDTAKAPKPDNAAVPKADDTASAPQADELPSQPQQHAWIVDWLLRIGVPAEKAQLWAKNMVNDGIDTAPEVLALNHEDLYYCDDASKALIISKRHLALDLDADGIVSEEEYAAAGIAPPKAALASSSSALKSFRRAVDTMSMVRKMTWSRDFQPCFLPGVSSEEDVVMERSKMAHIAEVDKMVQEEWDEALEEIQEEVQCQQKKSTAQMSCNTAMAMHNFRHEGNEAVYKFDTTMSTMDLAAVASSAQAEEEAAARAAAEAEQEHAEAMAKYQELLAAEEAREQREEEIQEDTVLAMARHTAYRQATKAQGKAMAHGVAKSLTRIAKKNLERERLERGLKLQEEEAREKLRAEEYAQKQAAAAAAATAKKEAAAEASQPIPMAGLLKMDPITNFYGEDGPRDDHLKVYGQFMEMGCKLYAPAKGPIVTGAPFTFCMEANSDLKEIGVLADSEFPYALRLKSESEGDRNMFYGHVQPEIPNGRCDSLTFYALTDNGGGQSLAGLFQWEGCITASEALAKGSSKEEEIAAAEACMHSGDFESAVDHLSTALVFSNDPESLTMRAKGQLAMKQYLKAAQDVQMAIALDPGAASAWEVKAEIEFTQGNYRSCIESCAQAPSGAAVAMWEEKAQAQLASESEQKDRFKEPDEHATSCPETDDVVGSVESLAAYLTEPFTTDLLKHRVIFRWITDHISYNGEGFRTGDYGDLSPAGVLKSRTGVCSGYSSLYKAMADKAGIEAIECSGYCKGFGHQPGKPMKVSHAWNCIKLDGDFVPIDSTWAAGSLDSSYRFNKRFEEFWWATPPEQFIYSHLPQDEQWTCLATPPSLDEFSKSLNLKGGFFTAGLEMESHKELIINAKPQSKFTIKIRETGPRVYLMSNVDGDSNAVKLTYKNGVHFLAVTAPRSRKQHTLDIFFGKEEYGSYDHLLSYTVVVK